MKIKYFKDITGRAAEHIQGQNRYAYSLSDTEDFYDMTGWAGRGGYPGAVIRFYDLESREMHLPFEKKHNVMYGRPVFWEGAFYFLQGDFERNLITLYRYLPGAVPTEVTTLAADEVDLYNLGISGEGIHITSQRENFTCYYPEKFTIPLMPHETALLIADERVYIDSWVEEDWDEEKNRAGENYQFYSRLVVKDFEGNVLSDEIGSLCEMEDGSWWVS